MLSSARSGQTERHLRTVVLELPSRAQQQPLQPDRLEQPGEEREHPREERRPPARGAAHAQPIFRGGVILEVRIQPAEAELRARRELRRRARLVANVRADRVADDDELALRRRAAHARLTLGAQEGATQPPARAAKRAVAARPARGASRCPARPTIRPRRTARRRAWRRRARRPGWPDFRHQHDGAAAGRRRRRHAVDVGRHALHELDARRGGGKRCHAERALAPGPTSTIVGSAEGRRKARDRDDRGRSDALRIFHAC